VTDKELDRNAARRLAIIKHAQEVTGNVALTCRYYGISRQVFYRWYRRYEEEGLAGLRDRSKRPLTCPHETPAEVVGKIIYLRQNYHFGPAKISMYLKRYHDIDISNSGVWRILQRVDLSRLPAYQRYQRADRKWKRYEKPRPGHAVQVDVKFIAPLASSSRKKYYQFTAIDDCTRIRVLRIYDQLNQKTAIQFADYLPGQVPVPDRGDPDRATAQNFSRPSTGTWPTAASATSTSSPPHPRLNGKVERSHRIDAEEFYRQLKGVLIDDAQLFNDKLQEWQDFYNYHRPHGSLGGQTPYERLLQKTIPATTPE
jgi:transposase InsO family protein